MTPAVEFKDVTKRFAGAASPALDHVNLTIQPGELVCVLGTSGGGKTTLIKLINRLHDPDSGTVLVNGRDVSTIDPVTLRRGIGYVIQQTGLFPHMSVAKNIACVPTILGWDRDRVDARVDELLNLVHLDPAVFQTATPPSSRAGSSNASASCAPSRPPPTSCCSTSPSGPSTPSPAPACKTSSCAYTLTAARPSSS